MGCHDLVEHVALVVGLPTAVRVHQLARDHNDINVAVYETVAIVNIEAEDPPAARDLPLVRPDRQWSRPGKAIINTRGNREIAATIRVFMNQVRSDSPSRTAGP
jgi:hypothetical protein